MTKILDQVKNSLRMQLGKIYRDLKNGAPAEEWREFESWFWKIRPHLEAKIVQSPSNSQPEEQNLTSATAESSLVLTENSQQL